METKVKEVAYYDNHRLMLAEGELVLVKGGEDDKERKPIIISRTEKIEVGDWYFASSEHEQESFGIQQCKVRDDTSHYPLDWHNDYKDPFIIYGSYKILVLPEQFHPEFIDRIVKGTVKNGDKIGVGCKTNANDEGLMYKVVMLNDKGYTMLYTYSLTEEVFDSLTEELKRCQFGHNGLSGREYFYLNYVKIKKPLITP